MYHSKPWVPENVSPSVASFVSTRPTFGSQTSSRKPTEASAHSSYSQFAISGEIERELDNGKQMFQANLWSSTAMGWRTRSPLRLTHLSTSHLRQTRRMDHWMPISAPFSGKPLPHLRLYTWHDNNYCFRVQNHADRQPYSRDGDRRKKSCSKEQFLSLILLLRHWPSEYGDSVCREGRRSEALQKADKAPDKVKRLLVKKHIGKWWASQEAKIVGVRATKHENKNLGNSRGAEHKESAHKCCKSQKNKVEDKKGKLFCRPGDLCFNFFFIVDVRVWCRRGQRRPGQEVGELEAAEEKQPLMRWWRDRDNSNDLNNVILRKVEDPVTLVNFGDWAAQWDELEEAWWLSWNILKHWWWRQCWCWR